MTDLKAKLLAQLDAHRLKTQSLHCPCGEWSYDGDNAHDEHVADQLAAVSAAELADAWEWGFNVGAEWSPVSASGIPSDPPNNPLEATA